MSWRYRSLGAFRSSSSSSVRAIVNRSRCRCPRCHLEQELPNPATIWSTRYQVAHRDVATTHSLLTMCEKVADTSATPPHLIPQQSRWQTSSGHRKKNSHCELNPSCRRAVASCSRCRCNEHPNPIKRIWSCACIPDSPKYLRTAAVLGASC